jgi:hypothetical protein
VSESAAPPAPARKGRWRRRIFIALLAVVAFAVLVRLVIIVAFPPVFRSVAARYGLKPEYERMELYFLGTDVGLWHVTFTPLEGGDPVISSNYCRANISTLNLLRGRLVVRRLEADTVNLLLDRHADGSIPLVQKLVGGATEEELASIESALERDIINLTSPLQIEAFRLNRVRARVRDQSVSPPLDSTFDLNVRLDDLASDVRPTKFQIELSSDDLLDVMRIEGEGRAHKQNLDANVRVFVRGLHAEPAAGYLAPLGLKPAAGDISFQLTGTVKAWPATQPAPQPGAKPGPPPAIQGSIQLAGVAATADLQQAVALARVQLDADAITTRRADFSKLIIEGIRCNARRTSDGGFWVGGMKFFAIDAPSAPATQPALRPGEPAVAASSPPVLRFRLGEFVLRDVQATLHDEFISPQSDLTVQLDELSVRNVVNDPDQPEAAAEISGTMSAPGIVKAASITGTAKPFAPTRAIELKVQAEGIRPDALKPYLDAAGVESLLKDGSFTTSFTASGKIDGAGRIMADASIDDVRLSDGGEELFAMDRVRVGGASIDPATAFIRVSEVELTGPRLDGRRESSGALAMLGLRTLPPRAPSAHQSSAPTVGRNGVCMLARMPNVEIGKFTWSGARVRFADEFVTPASRIDLTDTGVEVANLRLGNVPTTQPAEPGTIRAWLAAPGLAERLDLGGTIEPGSTATSLHLEVSGKGITAAALAPHLRSIGIEPALKDGALSAAARITFNHETGAASIGLRDVRFADGADELLGVDALQVQDVRMASDEISVGAIQLDRPRARAMRDADGTLVAAGIRTMFSTTQPAAAPAGGSAPTQLLSLPIVIVLGQVRVNEASLHWLDRATPEPVDASLTADVKLDAIVLGRESDPSSVAVKLRSPGVFESIDAEGKFSLAPGAPSAQLNLSGSGITGGPLQVYFPQGASLATRDGRFSAKVDAAISPSSQGGQTARVVVTDVDWRDGDQGPRLFGFDTARMLVSRFDPAGKVIAVDEISLAGFEAEARKTASGAVQALGIQFAQADAPAAAPTTLPSSSASTGAPRKALDSLPLVSLAKLDVNVKRLAFVDDSRPDSAPLAVADFSLRNKQPIQMLGNDPAALPPAEFELSARIEPLIREIAATAQIAPFSTEATMKAGLAASGISGDGLLGVFPALRDRIDGSKMPDGGFRTQVEATLRAGRRGLVDFNPARPFEFDLFVKETAFRANPAGPVLAGLEELRADQVRIDPIAKRAIAKSVELTKPVGQVVRDGDGIHVLGWTIKLPTDRPGNGDSTPSLSIPEPPARIAASNAPSTVPPTTQPDGGEIRIDRLLISGIDFLIEDRAVNPPLVVPLTGLDVEVRDLTSRALSENRTIRFNALLNSGKIPMVTEQGATTDREVFAQAAASGRLSLYPQPKGWVKSSISGLELISLAGEAKQAQVELGGGIFDGSIDTRFPGDGSMENKVRVVFTDLKLSEAADGPIRRILQLPQPLDMVVGVLEDPSGGITVPLDVPVKQGEINRGAVVGSAVGAVAGVVATGLASSPIKVGMGVGALVGLEGEKDNQESEKSVVLSYFVGETSLGAEDEATLAALLDRLRKDRNVEVTLRQQLGGGDISRAAVRANPSPEDCRELAYRLRRKKLDLQAQRAELAGRTRGELAARSPAEAEAYVARLRGIDREVAATDDLLDRVYDLLRPGADRQADRRTRAAAIALGQARLDTLQDVLLSQTQIPEINQRVKVVRATFAAPEDAGDTGGGRVIVTLSKRPKK